jgi:serine/threonine-protein kinase
VRAEPAPAVELPPRVTPSRETQSAAPQRKPAPGRPETRPSTVVVLADPKAAQPAEKPLAQAAEAELAVLALAITPWGQVFVDGRSRGVSPPLQEVELTPGTHRIEVRNTASEPHVVTVNAKPGARLRIKHKFN